MIVEQKENAIHKGDFRGSDEIFFFTLGGGVWLWWRKSFRSIGTQ